MKCPVDDETLVMTERSGIEIDYCPKCRGVWLDRGELDKMIERSVPSATAVPAAAPQAARDHNDRDRDRDRDYRDRDDRDHRDKYERKPYYKKRESFLGELFDF